jgi:hypothetical protein
MKRKDVELFINTHLEHVSDLATLCTADVLNNKNISLLLSIPSSDRDKHKLKRHFFLQKRIDLYKNLFIESALEEQKLSSSKDSIDNYRYKARFVFSNVKDLSKIKGYKLLQKYGYYNSKTNPSGVVKDHRFSINEGIKRGIEPSILGHLCNCEFLLMADNARKSDKCSMTLSELLQEIKLYN